jgi:aspartate/methionine/tyrosine aminotransferase
MRPIARTRMDTIGTESAFEVDRTRARALEAQGRSIVHLQLGEPDFDTPAERPRGRPRPRSTPARRTIPPFRRASPACAKAIAADASRARASRSRPFQVFVTSRVARA